MALVHARRDAGDVGEVVLKFSTLNDKGYEVLGVDAGDDAVTYALPAKMMRHLPASSGRGKQLLLLDYTSPSGGAAHSVMQSATKPASGWSSTAVQQVVESLSYTVDSHCLLALRAAKDDSPLAVLLQLRGMTARDINEAVAVCCSAADHMQHNTSYQGTNQHKLVNAYATAYVPARNVAAVARALARKPEMTLADIGDTFYLTPLICDSNGGAATRAGVEPIAALCMHALVGGLCSGKPTNLQPDPKRHLYALYHGPNLELRPTPLLAGLTGHDLIAARHHHARRELSAALVVAAELPKLARSLQMEMAK